MRVNRVKRGLLGVNEGKQGETWLTWGKCRETALKVANLGEMRVNRVKRGLLGVNEGKQGEMWVTWSK